jgi:hypothetical protein
VSPHYLEWDTGEASRLDVTPSGSLRLEFGAEVTPSVRARIEYALRVFAAIYGYSVDQDECRRDSIGLFYGERQVGKDVAGRIHIPARYRPRDSGNASRQPAKHAYANETLCLFFGIDESTRKPDWLGELFEWISSSHEQDIADRDPVGRIPFSRTIFASQGLTPQKPYAMFVMAWFQNELMTRCRTESLPKAVSPVPGVEHIVVCSHDIDFYYTSRWPAVTRLLKNLVISVRPFKDASFFDWSFRHLLEALRGKPICDYLDRLAKAGQEHDFRSTVFAVSRKAHRRDPAYRLQDIATRTRSCVEKGFSLGLHGSYESIVGGMGLIREVAAMADGVGIRPSGSRQHWLRFGDYKSLFDEVQKAGLLYDSTLGFAEIGGFRNGACFAFPPYDFASEKPYPFLEIPLVLMDGSLEAAARSYGEDPGRAAVQILSESRKLGWGGIATNWHNPLEPIQVPDKINKVFWDCVGNRDRRSEKWIGASEFLSLSLTRYQNAGLLRDIELPSDSMSRSL